jgi:hypothetical protein
MSARISQIVFSTLVPLSLAQPVLAMAPPYPQQGIAGVPDGVSEPFVGRWAVVDPASAPNQSDIVYATCDAPLRIEAADEHHIFLLAADQTEGDAATQLRAVDGTTTWEPIAGGPNYVAVWVSPNGFHLYERWVIEQADWGTPLVYTRCP